MTPRDSFMRILCNSVARLFTFSVEMFTVVGSFVCSLLVFFCLRLLAGWFSDELCEFG
jgi:hypothetical protein